MPLPAVECSDTELLASAVVDLTEVARLSLTYKGTSHTFAHTHNYTTGLSHFFSNEVQRFFQGFPRVF